METVKSLGRVCPQPTHWHRLWVLLPNRKRVGVGWVPALPMILAVERSGRRAEVAPQFQTVR